MKGRDLEVHVQPLQKIIVTSCYTHVIIHEVFTAIPCIQSDRRTDLTLTALCPEQNDEYCCRIARVSGKVMYDTDVESERPAEPDTSILNIF